MPPRPCTLLGAVLTFGLLVAAIRPAVADCVASGRAEAAGPADLERRAAALPFREGRLWKLSRGSERPSYLFGTLHVADRRLARLPELVAEHVSRASVLALETTDVSSLGVGRLDARSRAELQEVIRAAPDRRAEMLLDGPDFAALRRLAAERGVPEAGARTWNAATLALMLDRPGCAAEAPGGPTYLDAMVARLARSRGVEIIGIETLAEQFSIFDGLAAETERALLISVLRQAPYGADAVQSQVARYLDRDAGGIVVLMQDGPVRGEAEARTPREFLDRLLDQRTLRMAKRIQPLLDRGNAVVAVGIAHLPGTSGLVALLERAGYSVSSLD
ncbi:TraB/GumN family protein [Enterovirga sp.]|uniref:TraB/GumN family protein n=1 Tax=Enterovirga sp. TaxID=2026350 RepID=UPI002615B83D|nr:TraB/GumN family protein [Enterovirga sp.]MDB5592199.1 TraB/GumN family protein [Enterovirga sp.]